MELPERTSNLLRIPIPFPIVKRSRKRRLCDSLRGERPSDREEVRLKEGRLLLTKMDMTKLSKSNFENVVKEIRSQTGIRHPYIVELLDHMKDGNLVYLLLSYAEKWQPIHIYEQG
jgi:hypothetical protein